MPEERIEIRPRVCNGKPVIKGTRIPVTVILEQLADGQSWDALLKGLSGNHGGRYQGCSAFPPCVLETRFNFFVASRFKLFSMQSQEGKGFRVFPMDGICLTTRVTEKPALCFG